MHVIETVHAEPRETLYSPCYRVNFWQQPHPGFAWNLDAYALSGAEDVSEVLRWADEHSDGRPFEVFAELDDEPDEAFQNPRKTALIHLLGSNSNAGEPQEITSFKKI